MQPAKFKTALIFILFLSLFGALAMAQDGGDSTNNRPAGGSYTIQYGDTLDVLGQLWDVSVEALKQNNAITNLTILQPGDVIVIPPDAPPYGQFPAIRADSTLGQGGGGGAASNVSGSEYVVQRNDTPDTIARSFDVSVVSLIKANNITNTKRIFPGTVLIIPDDAPPYGEFPPLENAASADSTLGAGGGGNFYVVQPMETLDGIAARNNFQTKCLAEANDLQYPGRIYPGQQLVLDTTCPAYDGFDVVGQGSTAPVADEG